MLVPLSWLKEYVEIDIPPEELGEMLTMAGLELEDMHYRGKGLDDIVVARILEIEKHPNADRLRICVVTDGTNSCNVVCGADNMEVNDTVALAPIGAKLPPTEKFPEGLEVKETKIRGEVSEGMLCAENELGLSDESDGIMVLSRSLSLGSRLVDELFLDDEIFEIAITPNRPDCLSIFGIAREVASILGKKLKSAEFCVDESSTGTSKLVKININDPSGCPRYTCRVIEDVQIGPSPDWLKNRLQASGIRSINNVVDITNFVLLEFGQPLHAFDYDLLEEKSINVRFAKKEELLTILDGQERKLTKNDLVICDGDVPIALGGVMGGLNTEVSEKTRNVLLESAYFDPVTIRKTSKRTGFKSESSYRFERGVDPNNVVFALDRAAFLIVELTGGKLAKAAIDVYPSPIEPKEVNLSVSKVNEILGIEISSNEITDILKPLEFEVLEADNDKISLRIPTFRVDITREIDVIEEIGRLFGYNNISMASPSVEMLTDGVDYTRELILNLKHIFISSGFFEAINYSFEDPDLVQMFSTSETLDLLNPLTDGSSVMRTSILPGLIKDLKTNLSRQVSDIRLFEHGKVFLPKGKGQLPKEETRLSVVATGRRKLEVWNDGEFNFFDLKNVLNQVVESLSFQTRLKFVKNEKTNFLHPGKSSTIFADGIELGIIGELHPDYLDRLEIDKKVCLLDINVNVLAELYENYSYSFKSIPKFPSVRRDISFIVDKNVTAGEMIDKVSGVSYLVEDAWVFDVFEGDTLSEDKKSVGISILLRSKDKTLTDEDANAVQNLAISELSSSLGAELRSM